LAAPDHLPVPRAQSRYGGGDSLTIWRRQGKTSRIKALTMLGGGLCPHAVAVLQPQPADCLEPRIISQDTTKNSTIGCCFAILQQLSALRWNSDVSPRENQSSQSWRKKRRNFRSLLNLKMENSFESIRSRDEKFFASQK
jgi:hypothetical protein